MPDRLKMFSNTSEPEYRITGICTNRYRMMYAMENHSLEGLAVRTDELFCVLTPSHLHRKTVGA